MMGWVRITQIDGKLPNLALMKLSAWHKRNGDSVRFERSVYRQMDEPKYDAVYGSAIFAFSSDKTEEFKRQWPGAIVGGTGSGATLQVESLVGDEFSGLDYSLYPHFTASLGFTQRGCRLSCKFCVVPTKEGKNRSVSTIADIWRGDGYPKHLHLLDNDFFGQEHWRERVKEIRDGGFKVCLNQGINVRLIDDEAAEALATIEYRDDQFQKRRLYTAWDNLKDESIFFDGIDRLERAGVNPKNVMVYMLIGFDKNETWGRIHHRFNRMVKRGVMPYPMVYDVRRKDPAHYKRLKQFQRWVVRSLYHTVPWAEYDPSAKRRGNNSELEQLSFI